MFGPILIARSDRCQVQLLVIQPSNSVRLRAMLHVSLSGRTDLADEIYRQLRTAIIEGVVGPGEKLPPSRTLAGDLDVSRNTVVVAYDRLVGEGYATAQIGSGVYASDVVFDVARSQSPQTPSTGALTPRPFWQQLSLPRRPTARFNFFTGLPDTSLFPHEAWRSLVTKALRSVGDRDTRYGDPAGHPQLRRAIAEHLAKSRAVQTADTGVIVTSGTQQAIDICARVLLNPGDRVAIENPCYSPARRLFQSLALDVIGVPVDSEGLTVEAIPPRTRLVYVTPSHQYPLGLVMSLRRRMELLTWAQEHDAAIIEDDYDTEFRIAGRPIEPLQTLDNRGRVIYVGSFSKTMLPSLRIGYAVIPKGLEYAARAAKFVSDWHGPLAMQAALAMFIDEGRFARHLHKVRPIYRARHDLLERTLTAEFADLLEVIPSAAGLHLSAHLVDGASSRLDEVLRRARDSDVAVQSLESFAVDRPVRPGLMLGYGAISSDDIVEGLARLRRCF